MDQGGQWNPAGCGEHHDSFLGPLLEPGEDPVRRAAVETHLPQGGQHLDATV
jgi:hypothetical protein